jgi:hypothetical protein
VFQKGSALAGLARASLRIIMPRKKGARGGNATHNGDQPGAPAGLLECAESVSSTLPRSMRGREACVQSYTSGCALSPCARVCAAVWIFGAR